MVCHRLQLHPQELFEGELRLLVDVLCCCRLVLQGGGRVGAGRDLRESLPRGTLLQFEGLSDRLSGLDERWGGCQFGRSLRTEDHPRVGRLRGELRLAVQQGLHADASLLSSGALSHDEVAQGRGHGGGAG